MPRVFRGKIIVIEEGRSYDQDHQVVSRREIRSGAFAIRQRVVFYYAFWCKYEPYASVPPAGTGPNLRHDPSSLNLTAELERDSSQPPMGFVDCIFFFKNLGLKLKFFQQGRHECAYALFFRFVLFPGFRI